MSELDKISVRLQSVPFKKYTKEDMVDMARFLKQESAMIRNRVDMMFESGEHTEDFDYIGLEATSSVMIECATLLDILGDEWSW